MRTLLCSIGRRENRYIREFVEHYKKIGFTNIALYDNNFDGEDDFNDVIGDYISDGFVILIDYRNRKKCQFDAYNECYKKFGKEYDWIAFFDCDEFLEIKKYKDVESYLSSPLFKNFNMIHVNWMCYGDNGNTEYEDRPVIERFSEPVLPYDFKKTYDFPENNHVKSIVRGGLEGILFLKEATPHTCLGIDDGKCCNASGNVCDPLSYKTPYNLSLAYLKHYTTKSTREYAEKILRGFPDNEIDSSWYQYLIDLYFKINEKTEEKQRIFEEVLNIRTNEKRKDVQIFMLCYDKKEYEFVEDSVITPLQCGAQGRGDVCRLKDNTHDNISGQNFFFAEMTGIYWIWKNINNAKYKGNIQYRRRLKGIDENTDFDSIFSKYDVICAKPYNYPENRTSYIPAMTVEDGYAYSHCKEDLDVLESIVKESFGEKYAESWDRYIKNGEDLYYSNGFVLPSEKYDEYCKFAFYTIYKWMRRTGVTSYGELVFHVSRNIGAGKYKRFEIEKREPLDCTFSEVEWQCKIGGFFSERLFTLWLDVNIPKERRYEVEYDKMENTYI